MLKLGGDYYNPNTIVKISSRNININGEDTNATVLTFADGSGYTITGDSGQRLFDLLEIEEILIDKAPPENYEPTSLIL